MTLFLGIDDFFDHVFGQSIKDSQEGDFFEEVSGSLFSVASFRTVPKNPFTLYQEYHALRTCIFDNNPHHDIQESFKRIPFTDCFGGF